jgi:outer membrane receptor protein involved in Fe transport
MSPRPDLALLLGAQLCVPLAAAAQAPADQPAAEERKTVVEERVVTGSHVRRREPTAPGPVTVISREDLARSGKVSIGDFLQGLPEQGNAVNAQLNNPGDGTSSVNLRSLGSTRTLVLVNGRRFVGGVGMGFGGPGQLNGVVDLYSIPSAVVERVEILKDGASAVYGSDAVAGVVNIITRKGWSGTEASAYGATSSHSDGTTYDLHVSSGSAGDRGSVLFSLGYFTQKPVWAGDRSWTSTIYGLNYATGTKTPGGSGTIPAGRFSLDPTTCAGTKQICADLVSAGFNTNTSFLVDPSVTGVVAGVGANGYRKYLASDSYNFEPANYLYTPQDRISAYASGDANLGSAARAYFEASYVNRMSNQKLAPDPFSAAGNGVVISAASQYNPFGVDLGTVTKRLSELGNRFFSEDATTFRAVTGLDGSLGDWAGPLKGWFWDASFNYGRSSAVLGSQGLLRAPNIAAAVGPSQGGVCYTDATYTTPIPGCSPLNLLGGVNSIDPSSLAGSLAYYGADQAYLQMRSFQLNFSGELFQLMSERPVGLAIGGEYRYTGGSFRPNAIAAAGESDQNNYQATQGSYNVKEFYAELSIPVVSGMVGIDDLEARASVRIFEYSTFASDSTYQLGLRYRPIRDVTLRATYSTAFRAPTIPELYSHPGDSFPVMTDRCAGAFDAMGNVTPMPTNSTLYQQCVTTGNAQGATNGNAANNSDSSTMFRSRMGGNVHVRPETATIYTLGVVFEPTFLEGFSASLDYYSIDLTKTIATIGAPLIMTSCFTGSTDPAVTTVAPQQHCDRIHRLASTGTVSFIDDTNANVGALAVAGLDLSLRYGFPSELGRFAFTWDGTYLIKYDTTQPDGSVVKGAGNYDFLTPNPRVKFNLGGVWGYQNFGAGVTTHYIGSVKECANSGGVSGGDGFCTGPNASPLSRTISSWNTWDAFVSYTMPSSYGRTSLAVGATNVFNKNPPFVYNNGTYASDPSIYDFMGRYMYARLTHVY